jgi:hypothetical protein
MIPGRIEHATRTLGAPEGWDEARDGPCSGLAIRDESVGGLPIMTSAWFPTPDELARIAAGAPVYLSVCGNGHPPVSLWAGPALNPPDTP